MKKIKKDEIKERPTFFGELQGIINKYSKESGSSTPDFILADYLAQCLELFDKTIQKRQEWYGKKSSNFGRLSTTQTTKL